MTTTRALSSYHKMNLLHPFKVKLFWTAFVFFQFFTSTHCCSGLYTKNRACVLSEMICSNGKCIPRGQKCDGVDDCGDGSDELYCGCGYKPHYPRTRNVVGGEISKINDWPWMAAIITLSHDPKIICGGTLISQSHILTAAHCFDDYTKYDVQVRLGEFDFDTNNGLHMDFKINKITKHEQYNIETLENDIAIIKIIRTSQPFTKYISPACLPPKDIDLTGQEGIVLGWGQIFINGPWDSKLQSLIIPVWNQKECEDIYYRYTVTSSMMCAGKKNKRRTTCRGDSGGPFMAQLNYGPKWFVAGIVSWNMRCALNYNPSVFTRVNQYIPWIIDNSISCRIDLGYNEYRGFGCLKAHHKKKVTWDAARTTCQSEGGDLFSPGDSFPILPDDELTLIDGFSAYWIGVRKRGVGCPYKRLSDSSVLPDESPLWAYGTPIGGENDCILYWSGYNSIIDTLCNSGDGAYFICQIV